MSEGRGLLGDIALLGRAFAVEAGPRPPGDWRPVTALYDDPTALASGIDALADRVGTDERRVAASVLFSGLAARVVAPVLAVAAIHDRLVVMSPDALHWQPWAGGLLPLWIADPDVQPPTADRLYEVITGPLAAMIMTVRADVAVSEPLLWGNAAAAVGGVLRVISRERPDVRSRAVALAEELLARSPWAGTGTVAVTENTATVRRRTCCLVYRIEGAAMCTDCVLAGTRGTAPGISRRAPGSRPARPSPASRPRGGSAR